ncbi:phage tail protein [Halodesulfovibrio sp. MK-HDV]|uniref:phage tail-collar fiber domain-containing protein n=1 Tax=Halodesulfovibrio sp. MK-HDV TaxID=2599925 RepID=UPI00136CAC05|nr:phage tail protein [Halodesulfovibrio sp. MK-HDV]KAF1073418.1 hypothetical protein MKHDV_03615 [Halodesulfovibrio sp. MK-HDV]
MALILTKAGLAALVEAEESGTKLQATHMALGDGNGSVPEHTTSSPSLINEVWRGALQSITINEQGDSDAGKQVVFEAHVPINAGGWYIREAALYAGDVLLAIGTHPVMWKPAPEEPTKMEHVIKAPVAFGNAGAVSLIVDPTVVLASQEFVNKQLAEHNGSHDAHPYLKKLLNEHTHTWSVITGKPSVFPPAGHTHTPDQVGLGNLPNTKSDSVTSTSSNSLATSKAVKIAYDEGKQALDLAGQKAASNHNHNSVYATKTHTHTPAQVGLGNLPNSKSSSVSSTSENALSTSKATKTAYDRATQALNAANTKAASNHNHDSRYYTESEVRSRIADSKIHGGIELFSGSVNSSGRPIDEKTGQPDLRYGVCDGRTYASPDGRNVSTPNMRDRFAVGAGGKYSVGSKGGADKVSPTISTTASHHHVIAYETGNDLSGSTYHNFNSRNTGDYDDGTRHTGGSQAHENRPPYIGVFYIKYL